MKAAAETKLSRARTALLLDRPWFGVLAMRLQQEEGKTETMATDGTRLYYNAAFVEKTPDAHLQFCMAHEVMHCALLHPYRRANRDTATWNRATDYAINWELIKAGLQPPADVLIDKRHEGKSADVIYAELREEQQKESQQKQQQGQQQQQPGPGQQGPGQPGQPPLSTGEVLDAPPPGAQQQGPGQKPGQAGPGGKEMDADDWKVAATQATATTKGAGKDPGSAAHLARAAQNGRDDWRAILHEFMTAAAAPADYSWMTPNRRHVHNGLYLPGVRKESTGRIVVAVDTSGSMRPRDLEEIAGEVGAIARETKPEEIMVIYCDTRIRGIVSINPEDDEVTLTAKGRGGTRFRPVFEHMQEQEPPACMIYCTDLDPADAWPDDPGYPVLWLTPERITDVAPFGRTVRMARD